MARDIWVMSDTHFRHKNILTFRDSSTGKLVRGDDFASVDEMDEHMIERWNSVVKQGDLVYHLGDVVMGEAPLPVEGDGRDEQPIEPVEPDTGTLTLTIRGEREGLEQTKEVIINVSQSGTNTEEMLPTAAGMRDSFIPWLAANHPEFGITTETEWTPTIVRPNFMVVMYYLFFTEEWEMGLRWHVMIPPSDWAEIYLRRRNVELVPSCAFKIPSLAAQDEPQAVDPPESVWR